MKNLVEVPAFLQAVWDSSQFQIVSETSIEKINEDISYIEPELEVVSQAVNAPLVIVSAPGAVGKTTFAKFAARKKKGYYWDLSKVKLGSNTFTGTLTEAFGPGSISKVFECLGRGEITLFIDSFDEAEIISGLDGIDKFLKDVVRYSSSSPRPCVILFSRSETASYIELLLSEISEKPKFSLFQIDYFKEDKAKLFIQNRILQREKQEGINQHTKHIIPFTHAIDSIFKSIAIGINQDLSESLWSIEEIRSFLGYSPVLETIGDYLYNQNYEEIAKDFEADSDTAKGVELIKYFIERILLRDQAKFLAGLKQKITLPDEVVEWENIYSPLDQMKFIMNLISNRNFFEDIDLNYVPGWLIKDFKESASTFIHNHPFLRNSGFSSPALRDYLLAQLILIPPFETMCLAKLNKGDFVLTPLFSSFYNSVANSVCRGTHVGYIYESTTSRATLNSKNFLISLNKDSGVYKLEIINSSGQRSSDLHMDCEISDVIPVKLLRRVVNTSIDIEFDLIIGFENTSCEIQNLEATARKITLEANELVVNTHEDVNSILIANDIVASHYNLVIKVLGDGELIVNGNGTNLHPWAKYRKEVDLSGIEGVRVYLNDLKRILEPFRKHGKNEFAKQYEFIDNEIVKNSESRRLLLEYLIENGIIIKRVNEGKYYMEEHELNKYGINWGDLKSLNYNESLLKFLKDFKEKYSDRLTV